MDNSIKNNKIVKYSLVCFIILMVIVTVVAALFVNSTKKKSMAASIENITEEINSDILEMSKVSSEIAMSSNPYDYIKNSHGYDKLVELGVKAIPYIAEYLNESDAGLTSYILAIAIEDIADCSVYEAKGVDWCTSKEFVDAWNEFRTTSSDDISKIIKSDKATDEKVEELKPYGVFVVPVIDKIEDERVTRGNMDNNTSDISKLVEYRDSFKLNNQEVEFLRNYLN